MQTTKDLTSPATPKNPAGPTAKRKRRERLSVRLARREDIARMVDIDVAAFVKVYDGYGTAPASLRAELTKKFTHRFDLLGSTWMPVVTLKTKHGEETMIGFMHCCPTDESPDDFVSWEKTTRDGWLDGLYVPRGKNLYVDTLSVDPAFGGRHVQDLMFMQQIGAFLAHGMHCAFFESRMPGFRAWVKDIKQLGETEVEHLTRAELDELANLYFNERPVRFDPRNGKMKKRHIDPLLRLYESAGCKLERLAPNAYQDKPSMNYGVVCTFRHPFRSRRTNKPHWFGGQVGRHVVGPLAKWAARHPRIAERFF